MRKRSATEIPKRLKFFRTGSGFLNFHVVDLTPREGSIDEPLQVLELIQAAMLAVSGHLHELDLPFAVPDIRELILLWPGECKSPSSKTM